MKQTNRKATLLRIPNEILRQIGAYLEDKGDIAAFVRTCRLFNVMFGDALYQRDQVYHKYKQDSCLTWAATQDRVDTLKRAIKAGIRLEDHPYLIFVVSCTGSPRCAELVLSTPGINPMAEDDRGWTPITLAASFGHANIVKKLVEHGASCTALTSFGWSPISVACCRGSLGVAKLLLDEYGVSMEVGRGADVMAKAVGGWSPITLAATNGHLDIVNLLLAYGADIHMKTLSGWTPLMAASDGGHASLANILLICGADVQTSSLTGWDSLICAADGRHLQTSKILLSHGADIMATTAAGYTPGIRAAYAGSYRLLNMFLKTKGFQLDHLDNLGRSAFFHAAMRGDKFGSTPIFAAARNGHRKVVELLVNEGLADFSERDFLNCTLLAHAQRSNRRQFVKYLKRHAKQANIPIWLEDPAGKRTQHRWDHATCHCNVCGRASVHVEQAYVCEDCNGGMVLCAECINAGQTCNNINHIWTAHRCLWNDEFGWTPPYLLADAELRKIIEVDDDGNSVSDVEEAM
ncbi:ankyrin [Trichoderma sp. SZMC 28013]